MRRIAVIVALTVSLVACNDAATPSSDGGTTSPPPALDERRVGVYGSLITELSGEEPIGWRHVYVVTRLCENASEPMEPKRCDDLLSEAERTALRERLGGMSLRFIDDPGPSLLSREIYAEAGHLHGDVGARVLIASHPEWVEEVEVDRAAPRDIDTPGDLASPW